MDNTHRKNSTDVRESLWWLTIAPTIWAVHFLASYWTAAIWCEKYAAADADATGVRMAIGSYTAIAVCLIVMVGIISFARHRQGNQPLPHDDSSRADQGRFFGFAGFLLSMLSAVATIFTALVVVFIGSCH